MLQRAMAKLHLGVGTWLALVSLAALLPMLALLVLSTGKLILEQQAREAESLARRAAVAADHLASELTLRRRLLETLADSDAARTGDLASLHRQAARVVAGDRLLRSISLTDAQGQQRLNTLQAAGMPLPVTRQQALEQPVFLQGQALVSPLVQGTLSGEWLLGIAVPVRGPDGQVRYALRASLQPAAVNQVLERQR